MKNSEHEEFLKKVYGDFEELCDADDRDTVSKTWNCFIEGLTNRYELLNAELRKENPNNKVILPLFHQIKTTLSYFSLEEEADIAQDFEIQAKNNDIVFDENKKKLLFQTIEKLI